VSSVLDDLLSSTEWHSIALGRVVQRSKKCGRADMEPLSVFLDQGVVPRASREDNYNKLGADLSKYLVVQPGDIVFNTLRTWQGGFGMSRYDGIVSPAYFVCHPLSECDTAFLGYLLRSSPYLAELTRLSKFMPPSQFDILWEDLKKVQVLLPPMDVQRTIARFLDIETARIDVLIEKKRQLLALLEERVDAIVLERVGESGLANPHGKIPLVPIGRILKKMNREPEDHNPMVTAYRDGQVTARILRRAEGYTESLEESSNVQGVLRDDVVVHGLDGFAGAIGAAEVDGVCSPVYHVCRVEPGNDPIYLSRMLRLLATNDYLGLFSTSTRERAVDFRNWALFKAIPIPQVDTDEQLRVAEMVRSIRPIRDFVERSEKLASERRQAVITAVITGEIQFSHIAA
jgi:type I restriction enzyme S subunit